MKAIPIRRYPNDYITAIPVTKTLHELLAEVNAAGWLVCNLFQWGQEPVYWRANVTRTDIEGRWFGEFCDGISPEEALTGAIINMKMPRNALAFEPAGAQNALEKALDKLASEIDRWTTGVKSGLAE